MRSTGIGTALARGFSLRSIKWPLSRASDVLELAYGKALVDADRRPGKVPVYGTNGRCGSHDTPLFRGPGVVIGRKGQGPLGVEWVADDYWVIDTAYSLRPLTPDVSLRFAYYLVKYVGLNHLKDGTSNPTLARATFGAQVFPLPPLAAQKRIGELLSLLDDKIELNRQMNETLEAMARALFKSWFVDFDPVRAKMAGRTPFGIDAATAALFPAAMRSGLPEGWRRRPLGELVEALSGGTPSKAEADLWAGDIPWVSPKSMTEIFADRVPDHVAPAAVGNGTRLAPAGSTLVMVRGMGLHECVRVSQVRREVTFNQDVKALVPRHVTSALLLLALLDAQAELLGRVESSGHGTGKLPSDILLGYPLTLPPLAEQQALSEVFQRLLDRVAAARDESRTLAELRDLLLPKLLSGELRIRDAERLVEAAL